MATSSNMKKLKEAYAAWEQTKGDKQIWLDLMGDQVEMNSVDENSTGLEFAKNRRTKVEAEDWLDSILKDWEMLSWTPKTLVEDGDNIAMFGHCSWKSRKTGKEALNVDIAQLIRFEGGKIVSILEVFDSAKAMIAATAD